MWNKACPARTSDPAWNNRFCTIPALRARTSATRDASTLPGNSANTPTLLGVATITPTATCGGCCTAPDAAFWLSEFLPQAVSSSAPQTMSACGQKACAGAEDEDRGALGGIAAFSNGETAKVLVYFLY